MDFRPMPLRHARVGLGDERRVGRGAHPENRRPGDRKRRRRNWRRRRAAPASKACDKSLNAAGATPIIVRPAVSKLAVTV